MKNDNIFISVVSPVYRNSKSIKDLVYRIEKSILSINAEIKYEVILICDGCADSWSAILEMLPSHPQVKASLLSRNFGQHNAILAGLERSLGSWVVVMDADLQDQPEFIPKLLNQAKSGYDIVQARRQDRTDNFFKKITSRLFYKLLAFLSQIDHSSDIANYGIYHRKVINEICNIKDNVRFFPALVYWVGFKKTTIVCDHGAREQGSSSYSIYKLLKLAFGVVLSHTSKPLYFIMAFGFLLSLLSFILGATYLVLALLGKVTIEGWASIMVSLYFLAGVIIFLIGVVGAYVGALSNETHKRPSYIISEEA